MRKTQEILSELCGISRAIDSVVKLFNEARIAMLTTKKPMMLKGSCITYDKVYEKLISYIQYTHSPYGTIYELQEVALGNFTKACSEQSIKNHLQYMKAVIWNVMQVYLQHLKNKQAHPNIPQGKQMVKQIAKQNQGMTNIEITQKNIKSFEWYAREYGVDFVLKKDKTTTPPKYMVFFKARDQDAIVSAIKVISRGKDKSAASSSAYRSGTKVTNKYDGKRNRVLLCKIFHCASGN